MSVASQWDFSEIITALWAHCLVHFSCEFRRKSLKFCRAWLGEFCPKFLCDIAWKFLEYSTAKFPDLYVVPGRNISEYIFGVLPLISSSFSLCSSKFLGRISLVSGKFLEFCRACLGTNSRKYLNCVSVTELEIMFVASERIFSKITPLLPHE